MIISIGKGFILRRQDTPSTLEGSSEGKQRVYEVFRDFP